MSWLKEVLQKQSQIEAQKIAAAETAYKKYWSEKREKWKNHVADAERALGWWRFLELDLVLKDVANSNIFGKTGSTDTSRFVFKNVKNGKNYPLSTYNLLPNSSENIVRHLESCGSGSSELIKFISLDSGVSHQADSGRTDFEGDPIYFKVGDLRMSLTDHQLLADSYVLGNLNDFRKGRRDVESKLKDYLMDKLHLR